MLVSSFTGADSFFPVSLTSFIFLQRLQELKHRFFSDLWCAFPTFTGSFLLSTPPQLTWYLPSSLMSRYMNSDHLLPPYLIPSILLCHTKSLHVLPHYIHESYLLTCPNHLDLNLVSSLRCPSNVCKCSLWNIFCSSVFRWLKLSFTRGSNYH